MQLSRFIAIDSAFRICTVRSPRTLQQYSCEAWVRGGSVSEPERNVNMRSIPPTILFLAALWAIAVHQPMQTAAARCALPAIETVADNKAVPEAYGITGQFERIVVLRFKYQTDLLAGLEKMVAKEGIKNAVILAGI